MRLKSKISISLKTTMVIVLLSGFFIVIIMSHNLVSQEGILEESYTRRANAIARTMDGVIGCCDNFNNSTLLQEYVERINCSNAELLKICINSLDDGNFSVVASTEVEDVGDESSDYNYYWLQTYEKRVEEGEDEEVTIYTPPSIDSPL